MRSEQRAAFVEFASARGQALHRAAYLMVGDRHLAQDLVQEALTKLYVVWPRLRDPSRAEAYCRKAITTTAISWKRRRSWSEVPTEHHTEGAGPGTDHDGRLDLWAALETLPPRQRAALVLRYYEDLTEAQTADAMDCAVGTVKSQVAAAIGKLRTLLGPDADLVPAGPSAREGGHDNGRAVE